MKLTRFRRLTLLKGASAALLLTTALLQPACDESPSQAQTPADAPGSVPSPEPSPSPIPSGNVWNVVKYVKVCPYPDCPAREGFQVDSSGDYVFGANTPEGPSSTGTLETSDFSRLTDHVARVMEQDLSVFPVCTSLTVLPGASSERIDIRIESGTLFRVYEANTLSSRVCWIGERARAENLLQVLDTLANEYVPRSASGGG